MVFLFHQSYSRLEWLKTTLLVMKLTTALILVTCLHVSAKKAYTQESITLSEKNAKLTTIFKKITEQTGYYFVHRDEWIEKAKRVDVEVVNASLATVMEIVLKGQGLGYAVVGKNVIIKKKNLPEQNGSDPISIRGKVTDENGMPIEGANITVKGTNRTVASDKNGEYELSVEEGATIIISYVGYDRQVVVVRGNEFINTSLVISSKELDVAIVQGYGTTTRRYNTGNISKITATDIAKQPVANPLATLHGRVPGLIVTQTNGYAGGAFDIQLRGQNSILQNSQPFFVIDGIPFSPQNGSLNIVNNASPTGLSPFYTINPNDIESIEVLKDADATAIYGSRGANGVILITTKSGRAGKTKITANINSSWGRVTRAIDMLNTQQYIQMRKEAYANDGLPPTGINAADILIWDTTRYTNFKKLFLGGTSRAFDASISVTGGSANTNFYLSGSLHRETTVLPIDLADYRYSVHNSISHTTSNKKVTLNLITTYSLTKSNLPRVDPSQFINRAPNMKLYDSLGNLNWQEGGVPFRNTGISDFSNPLASLNTKHSGTYQNLNSSLQLSYKPISFLTFKINVGYNTISGDEIAVYPTAALDPYDNAQILRSYFGVRNDKTWIAEPQIELTKATSAGKVHFLLGGTLQGKKDKSINVDASNYQSELLLHSIVGAGTISTRDNFAEYRYAAAFARITYNYLDKYIINLTGRRDGSSRFGPSKQFSNFGAIGTAWIFSSEKFVQQVFPWISFGKLRGSYGTAGNDGIGDYQFIDTWTASSTTYQGIAIMRPFSLFNPELAWEMNKKLEAAIDLGFFNQRVLLSVSYFKHRSNNHLVSYNLPMQTGFASILQNRNALVQNKGVEITLESKNIDAREVKWSTQFNISQIRNKLIRFPNLETSSYASTYIIGEPLSARMRYKYIGVNSSTGVYQLLDVDSNGTLNSKDRIIAKNKDIQFYGGLRNIFQYRGFELDILLQFSKQTGLNYLNTVAGLIPGTKFRNQPSIVLDRWQKPGDVADIQKYTTIATVVYTNLAQSDAAYSDASFIRCKTVAISYSFPRAVTSKLALETAQIYLNAQNLFTITSYVGSDPENQNIYWMPPLRVIAAGLRITF